jgi:hypothetical protein
MQILHNPLYAGAYAFGRTAQRTRIVDGRAHKVNGVRKPEQEWSVLLRDHHAGYITWQDYEANQKLLLENAHMKRNCARKSARGGRALLTGLMRCGRCGRMMRVFYGMGKGHAHRYQCRGDDGHVSAGLCIGAGGVRVDRAIALQLLEAVSDRAVEATIFASDQIERSTTDVIAAAERDLEAARYEASIAARRHELVDPAKRFVARELEARWNGLERVAEIERRIEDLRATAAARPTIDRAALMRLAHDLPAAWNAPTADTRTKQRLIHILIQEIVCDLDEAANEVFLLIHWTGRRHSELRVPRVRTGCCDLRPPAPNAVEAIRKLATRWGDRDIAVSLNRMHCKTGDGETWTTVRVRAMRDRLGIPEGGHVDDGMISLAKAAERLNICIGSAKRLVD